MQDIISSSISSAEGAFKAIETLAKLLEEQNNNNNTHAKSEGATIEQFKKYFHVLKTRK